MNLEERLDQATKQSEQAKAAANYWQGQVDLLRELVAENNNGKVGEEKPNGGE